MRRRVEIESDHIAQFAANAGSCDSLRRRTRCGCRPCAAQMRCTERSEMPLVTTIARPVQWVVSPGGSARSARRHRQPALTAMRQTGFSRLVVQQAGHALAHKPLLPAPHTGLRNPGAAHDFGGAKPSPVARMIRARHTCFCRLLRSATTAASRSRSAALTSIAIPSRIAHDRTDPVLMESYDCVVPRATAASCLPQTAKCSGIGPLRGCRHKLFTKVAPPT